MLKSFLNSYFGIVVNQQITLQSNIMSTYQSTVLWTVPWKYKNARYFIFSKCTANNILTKKEISETKVGPNDVDMYTNRFGNYTKAKTMLNQIQTTNFLLLKVKRVHWMDIPVLSKITWTLRINIFFWVLYLFTSRENVFKSQPTLFQTRLYQQSFFINTICYTGSFHFKSYLKHMWLLVEHLTTPACLVTPTQFTDIKTWQQLRILASLRFFIVSQYLHCLVTKNCRLSLNNICMAYGQETVGLSA